MSYEQSFSSIHAYRRDKGNYLDLVDTRFIKEKFDIIEFLTWNEIDNRDRCMDVVDNKMSDSMVAKYLYKMMGVKSKKVFLQKLESEKMYYIIKLLDYSVPLMQLSRISGIYYNKLQNLPRPLY